MKIFISWSGVVSHKVALELKAWLPGVIQAVEPYVSSEDIEKGARWFADMSSHLEKTNFGILCITPANLNEPWILFEAGALSKTVSQPSFVVPLLIGLSKTDLKGPLAQLQATSLEKEDIKRLLKTINKQLGDKQLDESSLDKGFEKWWADIDAVFQSAIKEIINTTKPGTAKPKREIAELTEEILLLSRGTSSMIGEISEKLDSIKKQRDFARFYSGSSMYPYAQGVFPGVAESFVSGSGIVTSALPPAIEDAKKLPRAVENIEELQKIIEEAAKNLLEKKPPENPKDKKKDK